MKMTRLEWRYLQKVALDHPYFDTHKLPLTEKEAKAIVEENIQMTGKEFVDSIYSNLGMTRPEEKKERFAWLHSISEMVTVPPIRKIAIALLVLILMTVFFTATPTGRAIAESMIQYFATLFEDGRVVVNRTDGNTALTMTNNEAAFNDSDWQEEENTIVYVDSFEEFTKATNNNPAILQFPLTELYYDYDESIDYLSLIATYEAPKGSIHSYQIWDAEDLSSFTSTGFKAYDLDSSIYYSIEEDGTITVLKIFKDSIWGINSVGSYNLEEIINFIIQ